MKLADKDKMPFGKHRKKFMVFVPAEWLLWFKKETENNKYPLNDDQQSVLDYINENIGVIEHEFQLEQKRKNN